MGSIATVVLHFCWFWQ